MFGRGLFDKLVQRVAKIEVDVSALPDGLDKLRELTSQLVAAEEEVLLFSQAVEQMADALVMAKDNLIHYVNRAFCRLYGYSKDEIVGQPTSVLFAGSREEHEQLGERFREVFRRPNGLAMIEYWDRRKDGSTFRASTTAGVVNTQAGLYWVSTIRDVTLRKQIEAGVQGGE